MLQRFNQMRTQNAFTCLVVAVFLLVGLIFSMLLFFNYDTIQAFQPEGYPPDEGQVHVTIDSIVSKNGYIEMSGWALKPGEDIKQAESFFVLRNEDTGEYYRVKTGTEERKDVTEMLDDGNIYDYAGVSTSVDATALLKEGRRFRVLLAFQNNGEKLLVDTQQYILL